MYLTILVALDGSERAAAAIPHALEMARRYSAGLVLLRAIPAAQQPAATVDNGPGLTLREHNARRSQAEGYLDALKRSLATNSVRVESLVTEGDPATAILATAQALQEACIVLTVHSRALPLQGMFGSVADHVLREAEVPVLLVKPPVAV